MSPRSAADPLRVGLFIESGGAGGAESVVLELASGLRARGCEVAVLTTRTGWLCESLAARGLRHLRVDAGRRLDPGFPHRIARLLRAERCDVIHSHLLDSNFYAAFAARLAGITHIATEHGDVHHTQPKKLLRTKLRAITWLGSQFTAVARFSAERLVELGVRRGRVCWVPNPVPAALAIDESERKQLRRSLGIEDAEAWLWLHVANHRPVKDQAMLLDAFARARASGAAPMQLALIGDGPERARLEQRARELGLADAVHFLGFRGDVARWLQAGDGFVLSSRSEALPMSLLEACGAGLLPVATRVGGIPELLRDREHGFLVEPGDTAGLARALAEAAGDRAASARLARAARERVQRDYSLAAVLDAYLELYRGRRRSLEAR